MLLLSLGHKILSAQVTTAMFAACFVHLLWPAETSLGSKVGKATGFAVCAAAQIKGVNRSQHWNHLKSLKLVLNDGTWRLKPLDYSNSNEKVAAQAPEFDVCRHRFLKIENRLTLDWFFCQALPRHFLQPLGLWSSAVPFLHGLDSGHRRVPRTRLWWSQVRGYDWWPWILYPGQGLRCTSQIVKSICSSYMMLHVLI